MNVDELALLQECRMFALLLPGDYGSNTSDNTKVLLTLIITAGTCVIMIAGLYLIFRLWKLVFDVIKGTDTDFVKSVRALLGEVTLTAGGKKKAVGVGLLGTVLILGFCVAAVVWGLRFTSH